MNLQKTPRRKTLFILLPETFPLHFNQNYTAAGYMHLYTLHQTRQHSHQHRTAPQSLVIRSSRSTRSDSRVTAAAAAADCRGYPAPCQFHQTAAISPGYYPGDGRHRHDARHIQTPVRGRSSSCPHPPPPPRALVYMVKLVFARPATLHCLFPGQFAWLAGSWLTSSSM